MDSGVILKRGYLYDKKVGILPVTVDRKRWYVLRHETSTGGGPGRVVLEIYKDEKSVSKGDSPKGYIDIHNVVSAQRVMAGKKQSFEILCPGIGYRLMANSELEADEWMHAIQRHILYKRDAYSSSSSTLTSSTPGMADTSAAMKALSLNRVKSHSGHTHPHHGLHMSNLVHERHLTMSNSHGLVGVSGATVHPPYQHQYFHGNHQHQSVPILLPNPQRGFVQISHSLPTPPHSVSPPSFPNYHFSPVSGTSFPRQWSAEMGPSSSSLATPSTSSDSSSLCSSSNTSFEGGGGLGGVFEGDGLELRSSFRVQVNDSENLNLVGTVDLVVSEDGLRLHSLPPDQKELMFWPLGSLRKYGTGNFCFTIITGRSCATGEGIFQFSTEEGKLIQAKLHSYAIQKAGRSRSASRRTSESEFCGRSPQHSALPLHSFPASHISSSPPYSTDQSHEYSRLHHFLPSHAGRGLVTQHVPLGTQMPLNHQFMQQRTQTLPFLPQKHPPVSPDSNLPPNPCDKELSRSSPNSVPNLSPTQSQSDHDQNQTLPGTCVLSERSSSASDSGCPSEIPGLASDHEYEGLSPTLQS